MKEIIINGRYLTQPLTGVQRYAHEVVRALDDLLKTDEIDKKQYSVILAIPPGAKQLPELENIRVATAGKFKGNAWEQISLPIFSQGRVLFNPCNSGPIFGGRKQVITIHDASVFAIPEAYKLLFRLKHKIISIVMGKTAARIITDSEFSKSELIKFADIKDSRIDVIPLGCEHISMVPDLDEESEWKNAIDKPYILSVGSNSKHKNTSAVIHAMEILRQTGIKVVIAGGDYSKVFSSRIDETKPWLHHLGYVSDQQLKYLYENALCFVYPSLYEGFGLPPLEAMSCGCPVLVSKAASLPEICGDAALYFDPLNSEEIAEKITYLLENPSEREMMIDKGYAQIKQFNWKDTGRLVWESIIKN